MGLLPAPVPQAACVTNESAHAKGSALRRAHRELRECELIPRTTSCLSAVRPRASWLSFATPLCTHSTGSSTMLSGDHFLQVLRNTITGVLRLSPVLAEPQEAVDPVCGAGVPPSVQPRRERGGRGGLWTASRAITNQACVPWVQLGHSVSFIRCPDTNGFCFPCSHP